MTDVASGAATNFAANGQGVLYLDVVVGSSGTGPANTITIGTAVGVVQPPPQAPTSLRIIR
jgi:hypothetical protein